MTAHVISNLLNTLRKSDKMLALPEYFISFFTTSLINSMIQEH